MSINNTFDKKGFEKLPIIGILRGISQEKTLKIAESYFKAGFNTLEVTMNTQNVVEIITALRTTFPNMNIGAGTVCNMEDLNQALDAGSKFIVTPIIDDRVIKHCVTQSIPVFPGAYTPTEIYRAWSMGADAVKVFPASQLGIGYIKDVLAPLNDIKLIPTGGVNNDNASAYLKAGAYGLGMGSSLFNKALIENNDFNGLFEHLVQLKSQLL